MKKKKKQFKRNLIKNNKSFKYKTQKSDFIISKALKMLHMDI